ncbi:hypothetical protein [Paenarthrobacter aurescens]|uniref:Uncharacterized protein n=1 Tax=Paenarthrobacter aurescens (strain TC1) TaxID=290340 RepID=A1RDS5_PAEAT|nr:hypothetical protein [Paenarthrobacter aurescens]ABM10823.1 hypothetical protein AAur_pTC20239 [Paenarthrobacter aurescens TC1]
MASDAHISHLEHATLGLTPSGRIFKSFRRWSSVPVTDLLWLRHVLERDVETDGSAETQELLRLVDKEHIRRSKSAEGIIPRSPTPTPRGPYPGAS